MGQDRAKGREGKNNSPWGFNWETFVVAGRFLMQDLCSWTFGGPSRPFSSNSWEFLEIPQLGPCEFWDPAKDLNCWVSVSISQSYSASPNLCNTSQSGLGLEPWTCSDNLNCLVTCDWSMSFSDRNKCLSLTTSHQKLITATQFWTKSPIYHPEVALLPLLLRNHRSWWLFQAPAFLLTSLHIDSDMQTDSSMAFWNVPTALRMWYCLFQCPHSRSSHWLTRKS